MQVISSPVLHVPSIAFVTMGCAKNEVDSNEMKQRLSSARYHIAVSPDHADAVIVNTCSFIQSATEESIAVLFDVLGLSSVKQGSIPVIVSGCMPARYGDDLAQSIEEVAAFVPCEQEKDIVAVVDRLLHVDHTMFPLDPVSVSDEADHDASNSDASEHAISAYVKISDGCDRFCSYCEIPYIRGRYHSFSKKDIFLDVQRAIDSGAREIVLIAQDTGRWGSDFTPQDSLASLLTELAETFSYTWFRIMYLQPEGVTDELLKAIQTHSNVCSYLDIPLQHSSEHIIKAMNRHGSGTTYQKLIKHIRSIVPNITLRTTLIVGFPGETEDDFDDLCSFVRDIEFDYVGVFSYSREDGTRSASFPDQIDEATKQDRLQRIRDCADEVSASVISQRVGSAMDVIVLGTEEDGQRFGRAQCQAPDVDGVTFVDRGSCGDMLHVTIESTMLYEMEGA